MGIALGFGKGCVYICWDLCYGPYWAILDCEFCMDQKYSGSPSEFHGENLSTRHLKLLGLALCWIHKLSKWDPHTLFKWDRHNSGLTHTLFGGTHKGGNGRLIFREIKQPRGIGSR
jgi:hypothetical protein